MEPASDELILPEPVGKQPLWLDSPATRKLLRVGRRGTKTRFAFMAGLMGHGPGWEENAPTLPGVLSGGDVVWISPTYSNLTTVLWREEIVPRMGHLPWVHLDKTLHDVNIPGLGSLLLRSGDREAIDNVRGVGSRLRGVIVDEAAWLDLRGALQDVILPACLDHGAWLILMSTTNAGGDGGYDDTGAPQIPSYFNLLCKEIQDGKRSKEWAEFVGTAYDNPTLERALIDELVAEYPPDSPKLKQEVFAELLESGVGLALPGITEAKHSVPAFHPPNHWNRFSSFDWGFHHPWTLCYFVVDEDGQVYQREAVMSRMDLPEAIDQKVRLAGVDPGAMLVYAGPDIWQSRVKLKGEFPGPTIAEALQGLGWKLIPATNNRVLGLNNARRYLHIDGAQANAKPRFLWMQTPGNIACLKQVQRMTLDPKNPEDVLKVDADHAGRGGDDYYDSWRYGLMSRPLSSTVVVPEPREGQSPGYDYKNHRPRERESADQMVEQVLSRAQPRPNVGRYRMPRG